MGSARATRHHDAQTIHRPASASPRPCGVAAVNGSSCVAFTGRQHGTVRHHYGGGVAIDGGNERFQRLDSDAVATTLERLHERIVARFPQRNLSLVAEQVGLVITRVTSESSERRKQERLVRTGCIVGVAIVVVLAVVAMTLSIRDALHASAGTPAFEWLPVVESGINDLAFAAIAIFFLLSLPARQRRRQTLATLHRLRSLAHVIDMHQLTKDPERIRSAPPPTDASIVPDLAPDQLGRYLDYCSELLSLVSKTAALCSQDSVDPLVLDTVSEIESLTLGMSRKIWQKISLLHAAP